MTCVHRKELEVDTKFIEYSFEKFWTKLRRLQLWFK